MNEEAQSLIEKKQEEIREVRNKHLISLGLIDESKNKRIETKIRSYNTTYDPLKNIHYFIEEVPIKLTDEEYSELCKYYPPREVLKEDESDNKMKKDIDIIKIVLLVWSILFLISMFFLIIIMFQISTPVHSLRGFY